MEASKPSQAHQVERSYVYDPLPEGDYIRCLVVEPGSGAEPFRCTLVTTALSRAPAFDAISYTWGSSHKASKILVSSDGNNQGVMRITANLFDALQQVRLPDTRRTLWADSICIDQATQKEKVKQIGLMGAIYRQSNKTLICLGPDHGHGNAVTSLVADINLSVSEQLALCGDSWDELPALQRDDPLVGDPRWSSYRFLCQRPRFKRVWVVQEAALSKDPRLLLGRHEIAHHDLVRAHRWVAEKATFLWLRRCLFIADLSQHDFWRVPADPDESGSGNLSAMRASSDAQQRRRRDEHAQFLEILNRTRHLDCTEAHDRIYAFYGSPAARFGPDKHLLVKPTYEKTPEEVYKKFAVRWLEETEDVSILSSVHHNRATFKADTPSWVPMWNAYVVNDVFGRPGSLSMHNASQGVAPGCPVFVDAEKFRLKLRGVVLDVVHLRSAHFTRTIKHASYLAGCWVNRIHILLLWIKVLATMQSAYTDEQRLWAFCRSLSISGSDGDLDACDYTPNEAAFSLWLYQVLGLFTRRVRIDIDKLKMASEGGTPDAFMDNVTVWCESRRFVVTRGGYYGLAPMMTEEGDACCIVSGLRVPVILRKTDQEGNFKLVGEAFIVGWMQGQALAKGQSTEQDIILC